MTREIKKLIPVSELKKAGEWFNKRNGVGLVDYLEQRGLYNYK